MRRFFALVFYLFAGVVTLAGCSEAATDQQPPAADNEAVILLHGLARTADAMQPMADFLQQRGYTVINQDYPSREYPVEELTEMTVPQAISKARQQGASKIHFVSHSMGGILVRQYLSQNQQPDLGRVVMLGPPNQGSEVVDKLRSLAPFRWLNGPAGQQLGTGEDSLPLQLGPTTFDVGIIAGDFSINLMLSQLIPGPDDGKVSVERSKLEGMRDHIVMPYSHPLMMRREAVMEQTLSYLKTGQFNSQERL